MKRVLIVDENVNDRAVLAYYVSKYFICDIYTASGTKEALERINIVRPDVIITDVALPVNDGINFIKTIFMEQPEIPVIALSAVNEKAVVEQIKKTGKLTYLNKPVNSYRIYESLEGIFNYRLA